jgi:hypothetical protein
MSILDSWRKSYSIGFYREFLFVVYLSMLSPLWGPPALWHFLDQESDVAKRLLGITLLFSVPLAIWCAYSAGYYIGAEFQSFWVATRRALVPLLLILSFLPFVGRYVERLTLRQTQYTRSVEEREDGPK